MKKYKLYNRNLKRDYYARWDYIKIHKLNIDLNETNIVLEASTDTDIEMYIVNFVNKAKEVAGANNLRLLINNLKTITVKNAKINVNKLQHIDGFYNIEDNTINVYSNNYNKTINHELLHASSSFHDEENGIVYSGFAQSYDGKYIGLGMTEGYTQYLAEKCFDDESYNDAYVYEKKVAQILETIIGEDKMKNLYFNANLYGLIEELGKYISKHDAYMLIMNLDFITNNMEGKKVLSSSKEYVLKVLKEINLTLLKATANRYYKIRTEKKQDEYLESILRSFPDRLKVSKHVYNITSEKDAMDTFKEAYKEHKAVVRAKRKKKREQRN